MESAVRPRPVLRTVIGTDSTRILACVMAAIAKERKCVDGLEVGVARQALGRLSNKTECNFIPMLTKQPFCSTQDELHQPPRTPSTQHIAAPCHLKRMPNLLESILCLAEVR